MQKQGFRVGPQNLPDGTRKRKADRIKEALVQRAKIKSDFRKVQKRRLGEQQDNAADGGYEGPENGDSVGNAMGSAQIVPHPDRQALMDDDEVDDDGTESTRHTPRGQDSDRREPFNRQRRHQKLDPYSKELTRAQQAQEAANQKRSQWEEAEQQRQEKIKDRERMNRMLKKSRIPGKDGRRRLGRESDFLLEKVKKLVGKG